MIPAKEGNDSSFSEARPIVHRMAQAFSNKRWKATCNANLPAPNTPYFTPLQPIPAGTASDPQPDLKELPKLFQPLRIRGVEFPNRIWLAPLCQYSAENGMITPQWHMAHLGGIFTRGPGHSMIEATAVLPNGRITPQDLGIWSDAHIAPFRELTTFAHSQGQKIGIQLAHAGRKASTVANWIGGSPIASPEIGGWPDDLIAPSAIPYDDGYPVPHALTAQGMKDVIKAYADAAKRAVEAGFDTIEVHAAHGFLLAEFMSPISNKRDDEYGGSFENRIRFILEVVDAIRGAVPESMPLFFRLSGTEWLEDILPNEPSWRVEDTARLAPLLYAHGVDLIDISSGGNSSKQKIAGPLFSESGGYLKAYQAPLAKAVMNAIGGTVAYPSSKISSTFDSNRPGRLLVATVGKITSGVQAEQLLREGYADVVMVGRQFLKNPGTVWAFAEELDVDVRMPTQIGWVFVGRAPRVISKDSDKGSK
ncbi:NADPH dehydrogenase [Pholiota conissans]|uniref:NADPH dehydrogenase n=1 Tax=Pholiota conissans TaxID=109636 RepID=A0A9P5Z1A3_9AGAR|nr:NADPH dehydrogenase [Pholiota conissans]